MAPVSLGELSADPHPVFHRIRREMPVAWVEPLDGWLVTRHDLCVEVMLDPDTFTVDDPRFSTQQVIGSSMLSLDGPDHRRHRDPFAGPFRAAQVKKLRETTDRIASDLMAEVVRVGSGDLRAEVAGPLAVAVMTGILDLGHVDGAEVLGWYEEIVAAVHAVTAGKPIPQSGLGAFEELKDAVAEDSSSSALLGPVASDGDLTLDEIVSNVAVLLFGGIVTTESSAAIAYRFLLDDPSLWDRLSADPALIGDFVEETFRLEPSASAVDRYTTREVELGGVTIGAGDLVRVSLAAANRDPAVFAEPDRLEPERAGLRKHVTFARGPHGCLGIHLARLETVAAVSALLSRSRPKPNGELDPITGLVFRVPERVEVRFT